MHTDLVIDADGHCNEPWEDLTPWMPREYHHRAPVGFADRHSTSRMYVEGRLSTRTEGLGPGVSGPFVPHIKGGRPPGRGPGSADAAGAATNAPRSQSNPSVLARRRLRQAASEMSARPISPAQAPKRRVASGRHDSPHNEIQPWNYYRLPSILCDASSLEVRAEGARESALKAAQDPPEHLVFVEVHLPRTDYSVALACLGTLRRGLSTH